MSRLQEAEAAQRRALKRLRAIFNALQDPHTKRGEHADLIMEGHDVLDDLGEDSD